MHGMSNKNQHALNTALLSTTNSWKYVYGSDSGYNTIG